MLIKQLQSYWVRVVERKYDWTDTTAPRYATYVLLAHDRTEASTVIEGVIRERGYIDAIGAFNLAVFDASIACPEHPCALQILPAGELFPFAEAKVPALDRGAWFIAPKAFTGWCVAGAHAVELSRDELPPAMILAALVDVEAGVLGL